MCIAGVLFFLPKHVLEPAGPPVGNSTANSGDMPSAFTPTSATGSAPISVIPQLASTTPTGGDWVSYTDRRYAFRFSYPNDWIVNQISDGFVIAIPEYEEKALTNNISSQVFARFAVQATNIGHDSALDQPGVHVDQITFGGKRAISYQLPYETQSMPCRFGIRH